MAKRNSRHFGVDVFVATVDGSYGVKGLVTDAQMITIIFIPVALFPVFKAVYDNAMSGQFSFEERMGCGFV